MISGGLSGHGEIITTKLADFYSEEAALITVADIAITADHLLSVMRRAMWYVPSLSPPVRGSLTPPLPQAGMDLDAVILSRLQFAFTLNVPYHLSRIHNW